MHWLMQCIKACIILKISARFNDKSKEVERMTEEQVKEWFKSEESGLVAEDDWK